MEVSTSNPSGDDSPKRLKRKAKGLYVPACVPVFRSAIYITDHNYNVLHRQSSIVQYFLCRFWRSWEQPSTRTSCPGRLYSIFSLKYCFCRTFWLLQDEWICTICCVGASYSEECWRSSEGASRCEYGSSSSNLDKYWKSNNLCNDQSIVTLRIDLFVKCSKNRLLKRHSCLTTRTVV